MLEITDLGHTYATASSATRALDSITFAVRPSEFACIVGPSGCGKTTLLRCISGLQKASEGEVAIGAEAIDGVPEGLALVFQDYSRSLFPWMSVEANVEFPLKELSRDERGQRVREAIEAVELTPAKSRYPWQLSGGMQQRVAIARAIAYRPSIMIMDEPFASVDAQTRAELEDLVLRVHHRYGMTTLLVTHDVDESVYLGDRVVVLSRPPTTVSEILDVDLPKERDQLTTREDPRFLELRHRVISLIRAGRPEKPEQRPDTTQAEATA